MKKFIKIKNTVINTDHISAFTFIYDKSYNCYRLILTSDKFVNNEFKELCSFGYYEYELKFDATYVCEIPEIALELMTILFDEDFTKLNTNQKIEIKDELVVGKKFLKFIEYMKNLIKK